MVSAFVDKLRSRTTHRASRARTRQAFDRALLSPNQIRTRWYRRILAFVLASIAIIALVEVVIIPGKLVRRIVTPAAAVAVTPGTSPDEKDYKLPFGMLTDEQQAKQKKDQQDRIEQRLHLSHEQLDEAYQKLTQARYSLESYCRSKLKVVPNPSADHSVPKTLVDVVSSEPTAQLAWSRLLEVPGEADEQLRQAHLLLDSTAAHFKAESFLMEDDRDMQDLLSKVRQAIADVIDARKCVDHIATLQQARAALAHQPPLDDNPP
jgi:hypothetical protein